MLEIELSELSLKNIVIEKSVSKFCVVTRNWVIKVGNFKANTIFEKQKPRGGINTKVQFGDSIPSIGYCRS